MLEDIIKIPILGVVPYMDVDIEDEDSVSDRFEKVVNSGEVDVAVIRLPHLSNYTDFNVFSLEKSITMRYVNSVSELKNPDLIILPGSKNTIEDLLYLKSIGIDKAIIQHAKSGKGVIGICGGYQMLANAIHDPYKTESNIEYISGLGLLDMTVTFEKEKTTTLVKAKVMGAKNGLLKGLNDTELKGYEIHMGANTFGDDVLPCIKVVDRNGQAVDVLDGVSNEEGNVFGSYIHGIFDTGAFLRCVINNIRVAEGLDIDNSKQLSYSDYKEKEFDRLADIVRNCLDMEKIYEIMYQDV